MCVIESAYFGGMDQGCMYCMYMYLCVWSGKCSGGFDVWGHACDLGGDMVFRFVPLRVLGTSTPPWSHHKSPLPSPLPP